MGEHERTATPLVAVVGRPNVGKSSLVNRILGRRTAIVEETPGVTRDRRSAPAEWRGRRFEIVDTGGLEQGRSGLEARVAEQAEIAIAAADLVLLVVDATTGVTRDDEAVARRLRRAGKPAIVVANKVDDERAEPAASEFHALGLGDPVPVSALHGRRSGDLLDTVVRRLPVRGPDRPGEEWAAMAIVGRPNVGKSSLLNALLRDDRAIVDAAAGTTRDPVDSRLELDDGRVVRIVDTAGMRRQVRITDPLEYFSWLRARDVLRRADAAVLVIDSSEGVTGHDQRLAEEIASSGRACVVCLNKWDRAPRDEVDRRRLEQEVARRLRFVRWAPRIRVSATTERGIGRVLPAMSEAVTAHRRRVPTARLNQLVRAAQDERPHPRRGGRRVRLLYAVQSRVAPPTIVVFATGRVDDAYLRYLEGRVRAVEPFTGSPLHVEARVRARATVDR
jgi:GTP-binding protein